ncbi:hypothetical protein ES703_57769 [subsurface metagenome]
MAKRRKKYRLPYWIRSQDFRLLNNSQKDFLGYLYYFGPDTCWQWNCRLQKKFHRCRRTIQYWLAKLKELGFVWIENPYGNQRLIHTRLIPSPHHWAQLMAKMALPKQPAKYKRRRQRSRGFPPPVHDGDSKAFIEQTRHDIINELVRRGETIKTATQVADQIILRDQQKRHKRPQKKGL